MANSQIKKNFFTLSSKGKATPSKITLINTMYDSQKQ